MRTVPELRERLLEDLRFTVWRPSIRGGTTDATEVLLLHLLDTLCFIDGLEESWVAVRTNLVQGSRLVRGHFEFQHLPFPEFVNEVASVYAEVAHNLGYLKLERLLSETEMSRLASAVRAVEFQLRDTTEAELHVRFGPPSHEVGGGLTTVACYGCEKLGVKWVYFDVARRLPRATDWLPQPLVRNFRDGIHNKMHLLPFGRRWVLGEFAESPPTEMHAEPGQ